MSVDCRCDCANCVTGNHAGCYYKPQPICCPYDPADAREIAWGVLAEDLIGLP